MMVAVPQVRPSFPRPGRFRPLLLVTQTEQDHSGRPPSSAAGHLDLSTAINEPCGLGHGDLHPGCAAHGGHCDPGLGRSASLLRDPSTTASPVCALDLLLAGSARMPASPRLLCPVAGSDARAQISLPGPIL